MLMTNLIARRLSAHDATAYRTLRLLGLKHDPIAFSACYHEESLMSEAEFVARIAGDAQAISAVFGAFRSELGELIGTVALRVPSTLHLRHKATLWGMYTHPAARGLGVGRALMALLLDYARTATSVERVLLSVTASNVRASQWYESQGFKLYGVERRAVKFPSGYEDDELRALDLADA